MTRSFPEAGDGTPTPPMAAEIWAAGADTETARFVARQLRQDGYYLVRASDINWSDIKRFHHELNQGQGVREDGGGFWVRCIMALFGKKHDPVETYQKAAEKLLEGLRK